MNGRCEVACCRSEAALNYLGHRICDRHWNQFNAEDHSPDVLRMALGIETTTLTATEDLMEPTPNKAVNQEPGRIR